MKKIIALIIALILTACTAFAVPDYIDLTGLWQARLAEGQATLFLRVDGTGSLQFGQAAYNVSWQQENGVLLLDQGGALVDGVYDESLISLSIGGGNLIFTRELPTPIPLDSDLSGQWRAPMPGGDSALTLNADGTAVLHLGPESMNITWSHEGSSVILYQDGYPVECIFDGVFISIFLGEGSICFTRVPASEAA